MIDLVFHFGADVVLVKIDGTNVLFGNSSQGGQIAPIQNLKLSKSGVIKEFPDLKDNANWHEEAAKRFKEKIKSLKSEDERAEYIIEDLKKFGYTPRFKQRRGCRVEKIS